MHYAFVIPWICKILPRVDKMRVEHYIKTKIKRVLNDFKKSIRQRE